MVLYSLHVVCTRDDTVCLAYYFSGARGTEAEDSFELALAQASQHLWRRAPQPLSLGEGVHGHIVLVQDVGVDLVFLLAGADPDAEDARPFEDEDELSLLSALTPLVRIVAAACDEEPTRLRGAQLVASHGKVMPCLNEAYPLGVRRCTDVPAILRAAKLKAFT